MRGEIDVDYYIKWQSFSKYFFVIAFLLNNNKGQQAHYHVSRLSMYTVHFNPSKMSIWPWFGGMQDWRGKL